MSEQGISVACIVKLSIQSKVDAEKLLFGGTFSSIDLKEVFEDSKLCAFHGAEKTKFVY